MVFLQVIASFHALFDVIGLPGNLMVILTIILESRFHIMRYILLASLAVSDFFYLGFLNSFRMVSIAQERWLYGETVCYLSACLARLFYFNTVLHLVALSYERYHAFVKSPLTYDGTITKCRMVFIALIWIIPIPLAIAPFIGWGKYVYNPELFFCEQAWSIGQTVSTSRRMMLFFIALFVVPFLVIAFLNYCVYKTLKRRINFLVVPIGQIGSPGESLENQQQGMLWKMRERKAAIDVTIITLTFVLFFISGWVCGFIRQFPRSIDVPAEAVLVTNCIAVISSVCNPIIYSIRKREFRAGVKNVPRRMIVSFWR